MSRTTAPPPAQKQTEDKQYAWHRHPAFIASIAGLFTVIGAVAAVFLGQAEVLPAAINPAPAPSTVFSTETATTTETATSTVTETVTAEQTEPTEPTGSGSSAPPPAEGLAITIRIGTGGKIGPNEWRSGSTPGANADVVDSTGRQLNRGCYPTWVLKRGTKQIQPTVRGQACEGNGFTMFAFANDALKVPGSYHLTVSVVTDGGAKATATADFTVT